MYIPTAEVEVFAASGSEIAGSRKPSSCRYCLAILDHHLSHFVFIKGIGLNVRAPVAAAASLNAMISPVLACAGWVQDAPVENAVEPSPVTSRYATPRFSRGPVVSLASD